MRLKQIILIILLFLIIDPIVSQNFKGTIKDAKTNKGIPYSNLGIPDKGYGVISNELGEFTIKIKPDNDTDVVQISNIGYTTKYINVSQLKNACDSNCEFVLNQTVYELATTTVRPNDYEQKVVGAKDVSEFECENRISVKGTVKDSTNNQVNKEKNKSVSDVGLEMGNKIKINKGQQTFIDKIRFKTCLNPTDTCVYRINIYTEGDTKKRMVTPIGIIKLVSSKNLLKEPVIVKVIGKTGVEEIDLSSQNIEVFDDFMIAIECLKTTNNDINLAMDVGVFGATDLFFRESTMAEWIKIPLLDVTFVSATVTQKKQRGFWDTLFK